MTLFLKIRSLELFLMLSIPVLLSYVIPDNGKHVFLPLLNCIFFLLYFGWIYSVGSILSKQWKVERNRLLLFRICIIIVAVSTLFLSFNGIYEKNDLSSGSDKPLPFVITAIALGAVFYCMYYVSKILRSLELNRNVIFEQHQKEFFLFFIFIIGIWILQPRINRLIPNSD